MPRICKWSNVTHVRTSSSYNAPKLNSEIPVEQITFRICLAIPSKKKIIKFVLFKSKTSCQPICPAFLATKKVKKKKKTQNEGLENELILSARNRIKLIIFKSA